jgi:hypothetical protein
VVIRPSKVIANGSSAGFHSLPTVRPEHHGDALQLMDTLVSSVELKPLLLTIGEYTSLLMGRLRKGRRIP